MRKQLYASHHRILALLKQGPLKRQSGPSVRLPVVWVFGTARFTDASVSVLLASGRVVADGDTLRLAAEPEYPPRARRRALRGWATRRRAANT